MRGVASCSWLSLPVGMQQQLNTLEGPIPAQISELGEHLLNVQVAVCQSKQSFLAAEKLPARGEWSRLVSSTGVDLWCDGAWLCCFTVPFPNSLGAPIQRCLTTAFLEFFFPSCHEWKVYVLLQPQQTRISSNPTRYCKPFSKLTKNKLFLAAHGRFSLEKNPFCSR